MSPRPSTRPVIWLSLTTTLMQSSAKTPTVLVGEESARSCNRLSRTSLLAAATSQTPERIFGVCEVSLLDGDAGCRAMSLAQTTSRSALAAAPMTSPPVPPSSRLSRTTTSVHRPFRAMALTPLVIRHPETSTSVRIPFAVASVSRMPGRRRLGAASDNARGADDGARAPDDDSGLAAEGDTTIDAGERRHRMRSPRHRGDGIVARMLSENSATPTRIVRSSAYNARRLRRPPAAARRGPPATGSRARSTPRHSSVLPVRRALGTPVRPRYLRPTRSPGPTTRPRARAEPPQCCARPPSARSTAATSRGPPVPTSPAGQRHHTEVEDDAAAQLHADGHRDQDADVPDLAVLVRLVAERTVEHHGEILEPHAPAAVDDDGRPAPR